MSFASVGVNTAGHFLGELLSRETKVAMVHVPYPGAAKAVADLVANRVDFFFSSYGSVRALVLDNKLRAIAVASPKRLDILSQVPTMAEQGFPAATMISQFGLAAPANTPEAVIRKLNEAFAKAARDPEVIRKTAGDGIELATSTPAEFSAMIAREFERLDALLKPAAAAKK
ncbi:MAG: tripartite tricarboxylate transporter substrate binding protein [Betaproteobacteria bacterium]|nr:tripartite tricarboxylate transporter substrate binding protein [Betaproteobacteria bacterium]